jgi:hypothetical protein
VLSFVLMDLDGSKVRDVSRPDAGPHGKPCECQMLHGWACSVQPSFVLMDLDGSKVGRRHGSPRATPFSTYQSRHADGWAARSVAPKDFDGSRWRPGLHMWARAADHGNVQPGLVLVHLDLSEVGDASQGHTCFHVMHGIRMVRRAWVTDVLTWFRRVAHCVE